MDLEITWSEQALDELEESVRRMAERAPDAAEALREDILQSVAVLAKFPRIGPVYRADATGRRREILCRRYRIFYRIEEQQGQVKILSIWHGSRREPGESE